MLDQDPKGSIPRTFLLERALTAFKENYHENGSLEALDRAIFYCQQGFDELSENEMWASCSYPFLQEQCELLREKAAKTMAIDDSNLCITKIEKKLQYIDKRRQDDAERQDEYFHCLGELGVASFHQWKITNDDTDFQASIALLQQHVEYGQAYNLEALLTFGVALTVLWGITEHPEHLESALT